MIQKIKLTVSLLIVYISLNAQQMSLEMGKVISKFDYKNSKGERLNNLQGSTNNHFAVGFNLPLKQSDFYFLTGLWYNKYAANGSDSLVENYYDWKVNYLGLNVGIGFEFFKLNSHLNYKNVNTEEGFTVSVQVCTGSEFMVQGTQTINNDVYKLNGVEQFDKPLIFAQGGVAVKYYATRSISVYLQYMGGKSFSVFKSSSGDKEKLNLVTHTISLGVGINLPAKK